jgi:hypothetical protein
MFSTLPRRLECPRHHCYTLLLLETSQTHLACFHALQSALYMFGRLLHHLERNWSLSDVFGTFPRHLERLRRVEHAPTPCGGFRCVWCVSTGNLSRRAPQAVESIVKFDPIGPKTDFVGAGYQDRSSPDKSKACQ